MLTLTSGTFVEDFFYGYPYDAIVEAKPPEFDYVGAALTSAGVVTCTPGDFTMHYGSVDPNPDVYTPYGGSEVDNPYYMRFPVMSWDDASGIFLTVTTTDNAVLSFDRSFSGYVGDRLSVVVNGQERVSITGSAGYSWTSTQVALGRGVYDIAIVLKTAAYNSGVVREGMAQDPGSVTDLFRYLRLCNLQITNVAELPTAQHQAIQMLADSSCTLVASVQVTSGPMLLTPSASLLSPTKTSGRVDLRPSATLAVDHTGTEIEIGKEGQATFAVQATLDCNPFVAVHTSSDGGGFGIGTTASLTVENTQPQDIRDRIRPLKRVSVKMSDPVVVQGRPQTPLAICEETVTASVDRDLALVLDKVDPFGPGNVVPDTVGGLTWRWSSIDAQRDLRTHELTQWLPHKPSGPVWTTPGAYRPVVENFTVRQGGQAYQVRYPSVQLDSGHLDHLLTTLPQAPVGGVMTWVFVGSFSRFRGSLNDSCPIIDYAQFANVDYAPTTELKAVRRTYPAWVDQADSPSIYFGLTSYGSADQTTSRVAYRTDDATTSFGRSDRLVVTDNTPTILVYVVNGADSFVLVAPLTTTGNAPAMVASIPRSATPAQASFALGKSRVAPPYSGSFLTGSMSLLEVAYAGRAMTQAQAQALASFYASLYAPVTGNTPIADYTSAGGADQDTEQCLIYANDPETELTLITGDQAVPLNLYPSTDEGQAEIARFRDMGVPIVLCSNRDYSSIVARLEKE